MAYNKNRYSEIGDLYARTKPGQTLTPGEVQQVRQQLAENPTGTVTTETITADQNNFSLPPGATLVRLVPDNVSAHTITGFAGGTPGRIVYLLNGGPQNMVLAVDSASSADENKFLNGTAVNTTITPAKIAGIIYDGDDSRWRLISLSP